MNQIWGGLFVRGINELANNQDRVFVWAALCPPTPIFSFSGSAHKIKKAVRPCYK